MQKFTDQIGVVIIGRNEGKLLQRCLISVANHLPLDSVVYADSGSSDESVAFAKELGVQVVELDASVPFTAARGRNSGFSCLMKLFPDTKFVQFLDGDSELIDGWLEAAVTFLENNPKYAIVNGRLRELNPQTSVYNRLCDMEWNGAVGDIDSCGGIFMIRTKTFAEIGGMNSAIAAGEEPEMCLRLRHNGWLIARIDKEMAWHDAAMTSFVQWWKRSIRCGKGTLEVFFITGGKIFAAKVNRALLWTVGWSVALLCAMAVDWFFGGFVALIYIFLVISLYPLQVFRVGLRGSRAGLKTSDASVYGCLMLLGKWAELFGICSSYFNALKSKKEICS